MAADSSGRATFPGVPAGSYEVEVAYGGATVYREKLEVKDNVYRDLECAVYDVSARFVSSDGEPMVVLWSLGAGDRGFSGTGDRISIEMLPEGEYRLTATIRRDGREVRLLEEAVRPSELRGAVIRLPIGRLALRIVWDDGTPFEGQASLAGETRRIVNGRVVFELLPFGAYNVTVRGFGDIEVLRTGVAHGGAEETIRISSSSMVVRVSDMLGRPIEGAGVRIQSQRVPGVLATATTGPDGAARLTRIPAALAPFIVTVTYGGRTEEKLTGPGEASITIPAIAIGGTLIDSWIVFAAIGLPAVATAILLVARASSKRRRGRT
jgi:hypothetical protein